MSRKQRTELLVGLLEKRILVLDGATGTALQKRNLTARDFGGFQYEGCNEHLVITRPDVISDVHNMYLEAGADIIETNSFGGAPIVLAEYGLDKKNYELNKAAAELARQCADEYTKRDQTKPRFVAGSMGPTTKAITVTGGISFDELVQTFYEHAKGLFDGGVDYFLLETFNDTRNIKAALSGIQKLFEEKNERIPVAVSATMEAGGAMLGGQGAEALAVSLSHVDLLYLGLNCATGPDQMTDHIRTLAGMSSSKIACVPNAGLPDENGKYLETPEVVAKVLEGFVDEGWINVLGGCCGTNENHIRAIARMVQGKKTRVPCSKKSSWLSGIEAIEITDEKRPIIVGERTNVIGSKKFKELIMSQKFDEGAEIAKEQVKKGAQIVDVCLGHPDGHELEDTRKFLEKVIHKVRVPLMIDTTNDNVVAEALTYSQGKAIINSVNLENGEERFEKIAPLAKKFGAALVVGMIDSEMAVTRERKLEIARRSFDLLVRKYKIPREDIYWDTLVFPCGVGDEKYKGSAIETIEAIRLLKKEFPGTKSVLGISNISFGLPPSGREVLNSVFLYHCVQAGLDLAIVNSEKLKRFSTIGEAEIKLCEDLLFNRGADPVASFAAFYREKKGQKEERKINLPVNERLQRHIVEGTKIGLIEDLEEQLRTMSSLEIINGPLMQGMGSVGKLFNENKLIVAEVLQSAESMKAAVAHLETRMEKKLSVKKRKFLLATVKGDVHDIGKNLVEIILSNNGFEVINLGIKVTSEQIIDAVGKHNPSMIGLSGLLVKSTEQMSLTASDLHSAGINLPLILGGAALTRNFVNIKVMPVYGQGKVFYAKDAMDGLQIANSLL